MRFDRHDQVVMLLASSGLLLLGLVLLSSVHSPVVLASPVDRFVTPGGSGATCSQDAPCPLQTAIAQAVGGDTIYVAQGT